MYRVDINIPIGVGQSWQKVTKFLEHAIASIQSGKYENSAAKTFIIMNSAGLLDIKHATMVASIVPEVDPEIARLNAELKKANEAVEGHKLGNELLAKRVTELEATQSNGHKNAEHWKREYDLMRGECIRTEGLLIEQTMGVTQQAAKIKGQAGDLQILGDKLTAAQNEILELLRHQMSRAGSSSHTTMRVSVRDLKIDDTVLIRRRRVDNGLLGA